MQTYNFEISEMQLAEFLKDYPNLGKNSHVGNIAVKVVELFFKGKYPNAIFSVGKNGADLTINNSVTIEHYEIKGTVDEGISWNKLKVSSTHSHAALVNGMTLIRVTSIGKVSMNLHFMKNGIDFLLVPEPRWSVKQIKDQSPLKIDSSVLTD